MSTLRKIALAAASACTLALSATPSSAAVTQLGFILDSSGSIRETNWTTIITGLSDAINTIVPADGTFEISVVSFSSTASTVVNRMLIDSTTTRTTVANRIRNLDTNPFLGSSTNYVNAFTRMQSVLTGGGTSGTQSVFQTSGATYVNFATDGAPNQCGAGSNSSDFQACSTTALNTLRTTAGVDNISIEGIGGLTPATVSYLQNSICYPISLGCDTTSPYNFPSQGFYIAVADAAGYVTAIQNKLRVVTGQASVPEPTSVALVGLALVGLTLARRRKQA